MSYDLDRRYQPERRAFHKTRWINERRTGWDRRARVAGPLGPMTMVRRPG